jgi:hypothetical protein
MLREHGTVHVYYVDITVNMVCCVEDEDRETKVPWMFLIANDSPVCMSLLEVVGRQKLQLC